jgi:hypothetical protein
MARLVGCVLAVLLVTSTGCSSADHYRSHKDGKSLYAVMHESVRTGDSVEKVQGLLGAGQNDEGQKALEATKKMAAKNPSGWPDGVRDDDKMIGFPFDDGITLWLQFRNGKLVNHNPSDFTKYEPTVNAVGSQPSS